MSVLSIIGIVIVILIAVVLILAASKPSVFRVERSAVIQAPPEQIFPLINDFKKWQTWSPYEKIDPDLQRKYSGAISGLGAIYEWQGNKKVGSGRMEILHATPSTRIQIKLDFIQPFEAHNTAEFTLEPDGRSTRITWATFGPHPFMTKLFCVFVNMDNLIGRDFATGLANLKTLVER